MPNIPRPDVKKFLDDPEFAGERDLFSALINKVFDERVAKAKADADAAGEETNVFDRWFGK